MSDTVAQAMVSEIGLDMSRFPTAGQLLLGRPLPQERQERRQAAVDGVAYRDLGPAHFDRLARKLHTLGCEVEIKNAA